MRAYMFCDVSEGRSGNSMEDCVYVFECGGIMAYHITRPGVLH